MHILKLKIAVFWGKFPAHCTQPSIKALSDIWSCCIFHRWNGSELVSDQLSWVFRITLYLLYMKHIPWNIYIYGKNYFKEYLHLCIRWNFALRVWQCSPWITSNITEKFNHVANFKFSAVTFLEYWKRKSASLAHHWDCMGFQVNSGWFCGTA